MRFLFVSKDGDAISLAERVMREGNEVAFWLQSNPHQAPVGRGVVPLVDGLQVKPDTVIVFDMVGNGQLADSLRKEGWPVIGGSDFQDRIELNRREGQALMRLAGIPTPKTKAFSSFHDARLFIKQHPEFLVFKPNGNLGCALTKVFDNHEEIEKYFKWLEKRWTQEVDFILQEKVDGVEVSVEGWFNGDDWIFGSFNSTIEEKTLMTGGIGPRTGCSGNVVWFYKHARPAIVKKTLLKLTRFLKAKSYRGPLDINTKGGKGLEFTARFGYDAIQTVVPLLHMELGKLLSDVARGQIRRMRTSFDFGIGVRLSVPPYPIEGASRQLEQIRGRPIGMPPAVRADFFPSDVYVEEGGLAVAGADGCVGVVTHVSPTLSGLSEVYSKIRQVKLDELQYRTDILTFRAMRDVRLVLDTVAEEGETPIETAYREWVTATAKPTETPEPKPVGLEAATALMVNRGVETSQPTETRLGKATQDLVKHQISDKEDDDT